MNFQQSWTMLGLLIKSISQFRLLAVIDILFYKSAVRAVVTKTLSIDLGAFFITLIFKMQIFYFFTFKFLEAASDSQSCILANTTA